MNSSIISWTDKTWNFVHGCSRVSEGCRFCYAERISLDRGFTKKPWTAPNAQENVLLRPDKLREPYRLKEPSRVFVNSMGDLFHERVPDDLIQRGFEVMLDLPQHVFQILTKRPERAATWPGPWAPHIWMGTSVENASVLHRIDALRRCTALVRFLSIEPMLGPVSPLNLEEIHWLIVGGESGRHMPRHPDRWMKHEWARAVRDDCISAGVPFFFKQSSGVRTEMGTALEEADGSAWEWRQLPGRLTPPTKVR